MFTGLISSRRLSINCLFCLFMLLAFQLGCGKKSYPKPPEDSAPAAVRFLQISPTVDSIVLKWQAPLEKANGGELKDLAGFIIERSDYQKGEIPDFKQISELRLQTEEELSKTTDKEKKTEKDEEGSGKLFSVKKQAPKTVEEYNYIDSNVQIGKQYEYFVVPFNENGIEGPIASILRVTFTGESSLIENVLRQQGKK